MVAACPGATGSAGAPEAAPPVARAFAAGPATAPPPAPEPDAGTAEALTVDTGTEGTGPLEGKPLAWVTPTWGPTAPARVVLGTAGGSGTVGGTPEVEDSCRHGTPGNDLGRTNADAPIHRHTARDAITPESNRKHSVVFSTNHRLVRHGVSGGWCVVPVSIWGGRGMATGPPPSGLARRGEGG